MFCFFQSLFNTDAYKGNEDKPCKSDKRAGLGSQGLEKELLHVIVFEKKKTVAPSVRHSVGIIAFKKA